jgi:hypothetical protein
MKLLFLRLADSRSRSPDPVWAGSRSNAGLAMEQAFRQRRNVSYRLLRNWQVLRGKIRGVRPSFFDHPELVDNTATCGSSSIDHDDPSVIFTTAHHFGTTVVCALLMVSVPNAFLDAPALLHYPDTSLERR